MTTIKQVRMVDVTSPRFVEVETSRDGKTLWVNVDGVCLLRCCQISILRFKDTRPRRHEETEDAGSI